MEEKAEVENIIIRNHEFNPGIKRIAEGDQVSWINMDAARHTVTFEKNEGLGSPALKRGQTYWRKFDEAGVFNYYCSFHPAMRGIIIVEEEDWKKYRIHSRAFLNMLLLNIRKFDSRLLFFWKPAS